MKTKASDPVSAATIAVPLPPVADRLGTLFSEHYRRVLLAAYRITGNMADAEDVAQQVFLRLRNSTEPAPRNEASYLYRAAVNGALDLLRSRKPGEPLETADDSCATGTGHSPESVLANRELGRQLRRAISELSPRAGEMFVLRYIEDLGNAQIAKVMNTSQAVVAVTLHHARTRLKKRLIELERGKS